jgi:dihydrofolate synthase/folylpolyglutamate synthase
MLIAEIKQYHFQKLHIVLGVSKEKAVAEILACLPKEAAYYFVAANLMRALPAAELAAAAQSDRLSLSGNYYDSVADGVMAAKKAATHNDLILITGSIFVVAEILDSNQNEWCR